MTGKQWLLVTVAVLLAALSLYLNRDWFVKEDIRIYSRSRPANATMWGRGSQARPSDVNPVTFGFSRKLQLTSVKVVPVAELATNKYAHPVWQLVTDSNSIPIKEFIYGMTIRGMRPVVKEARPEPLKPNLPYRLLVEAKEFKGQHDFSPIPRTR